MAYTDLTKLQTIEPLNINTSGLNGSTEAITTLQTVVADNVGNFWFTSSIFIIFIFLIWVFYRRENAFLLDITRSFLISSIWCLFISTAFLLSGWINTVTPIIWFTTIAFISLIGVINLKNKSL